MATYIMLTQISPDAVKTPQTLEQLEQDAALLERDPLALSTAEEASTEDFRSRLEQQVCRICDDFEPCCEAGLHVSTLIHHDVWYNHYRNLGLQSFLDFPWAPGARKELESHFTRRLAMLQSCTRCGKCEERCPYGLPVIEMIEMMLIDHPPLIAALQTRGWAQKETADWSM